MDDKAGAAGAVRSSDAELIEIAEAIRDLSVELGAHELGAHVSLTTIDCHARVLISDIPAALAAAEARRDAAWWKALAAYGLELSARGNIIVSTPGTNSAPLRALLTAAGAVAERPPDPEGAGDTPAAPNRGET